MKASEDARLFAKKNNHFKTAGTIRRTLLICGIMSALIGVGTDILASMLYPAYSFASQAISELFAIGAPTAALVVPLFTVGDVLLIIFALGVWESAGRNRATRAMALMFVGNAANGLVLWNIFPMHMRGVGSTFTDTMHVDLAGVGVGFALLAVVFGALSFRKRFRLFSIGTILILLLPSIVVFVFYAPQIAANLPTPWAGLAERISSYEWDLWVVMLAMVLLGQQGESQAHLPAAVSG